LSTNTFIPLREVIEICRRYRAIHASNLPIQCLKCLEASKEKIEQMYFYNPPKNDSCDRVNRLFKLYVENRKALCPI
jgi:hypothetical protein